MLVFYVEKLFSPPHIKWIRDSKMEPRNYSMHLIYYTLLSHKCDFYTQEPPMRSIFE
jgi:hypothetical protein